jgi:arsenate reductase (thioredoxin)
MGRTIRQRNILFLDENNACLSQMAEAVAKHLNPPKIRVFSAGVQPTSIRPEVYDVMAELGVSLQGQSSKQVSDVPLNDIDLVVSFGDADRKCATLPVNAKVERWSMPNLEPADSGKSTGLNFYREKRDEIDKRVFALFMDYWRNGA